MSPKSNEPDEGLQTLTLPATVSVPQRDLRMTSESNEPEQKSSDGSTTLVAEYQREEIVSDYKLPTIEQSLLTGLTGTVEHPPSTSHTTHQSNELNKSAASQESSSSQKSCEAYFTRRMEELGGEGYDLPVREVTILGARESCAEALELYPGLNKTTYDDPLTPSLPPDTPSETDHTYTADPRLHKRKIPPCKPKVVIDPEGTTGFADTQVNTRRKSANEESDVLGDDHDLPSLEIECSSCPNDEVEPGQNSDTTSLGGARSTLAEALSPTKGPVSGFPDITSGSEAEESTSGQKEKLSEVHQLCNTSRAIINHYFQEANAIELPRGHPTIALNSEQVQSILRVVADESARASYAMMEDIIERARRLSLNNFS